jgi:hypothetical protein
MEETPLGPRYFVRDNGVGFDMVHSRKMFHAFERLHPATQFEGTGIGLVTVKRVVERHGSVVGIDSTPGAGTTVRFTLGS